MSKVEFAWVGFEAYKSNPKIPHTTGANMSGMSTAADCVSTIVNSANKPKIDPIAPRRVTFIFDSVTSLFMWAITNGRYMNGCFFVNPKVLRQKMGSND